MRVFSIKHRKTAAKRTFWSKKAGENVIFLNIYFFANLLRKAPVCTDHRH
jgi:hypothetical protein